MSSIFSASYAAFFSFGETINRSRAKIYFPSRVKCSKHKMPRGLVGWNFFFWVRWRVGVEFYQPKWHLSFEIMKNVFILSHFSLCSCFCFCVWCVCETIFFQWFSLFLWKFSLRWLSVGGYNTIKWLKVFENINYHTFLRAANKSQRFNFVGI